VWYSVCGLYREQCVTVYVDQAGNSVVQCMRTVQGTVCYSVCGPGREQCGRVYVDRTGNTVYRNEENCLVKNFVTFALHLHY